MARVRHLRVSFDVEISGDSEDIRLIDARAVRLAMLDLMDLPNRDYTVFVDTKDGEVEVDMRVSSAEVIT